MTNHAINDKLQLYFQYTSNNELEEICAPLKKLNITFFLFLRYHNDLSRAWLTTRPEWEKYFCENELYKLDFLHVEKLQYSDRVFPWKSMPCQEIFTHSKLFNIGHGITFTESHCNYHDTFHFGTAVDNETIYNIYLNRLELFERFIHYFKDNAKLLIEKSVNNRPYFLDPPAYQKNSWENSLHIDDQQFEEFIKETPLKRIYLNNGHCNTYLTARELECISWLRKGKSVEEISMILNIKIPTAQSHIENIKKKFDCYKQFALGYKIAKLKIFEY